MNKQREPCFVCLNVNTKAFEKTMQQNSISCDCKVYAHRECWSEYLNANIPAKCPICRCVFIQNPMVEACMNPIEVTVSKSEHSPGDDAGVKGFVCCCSSYLCLIGIIGALLG